MERNYLSFHLEPSKELPGGDWRAVSPLGISCAAVCAGDTGRITTWYGQTSGGAPSSRMNHEEVQGMVEALSALAGSNGYTLVTWNGLGFDFPVLAEESGLLAECQNLARNHIDMKFHAICEKGYCPDLDAAALGMGLPGKVAGAVALLQRSAFIGLGSPDKAPDVAGNEMPRLWNQGHQQQALDYLAQDVRILADLAKACQERRVLKWISDSYDELEIRLPEGWLTPEKAANLPAPDTSGANGPVSRREIMDWLAK